ncbi:MAG: caspase family protein [Pseudomonadota bacterium]|nr:caspase family protein [Pseudomonadota bacterium]
MTSLARAPLRFLFFFVVVAALWALPSGAAHAAESGCTWRALVAGVSAYPVGPTPAGAAPLNGPQHDADLMIRTLEHLGFAPDAITVLADSAFAATGNKHSVAGAPTHANILHALDALTAETKRCDVAVIYLSGHGSREPAPPGSPLTSPDGMSSIFLPIDVGYWTSGEQRVKNALTDVELARRIVAMRGKGGFVWLIVDACQSGTLGGRGGRRQTVSTVPPDAFGIPKSAIARAHARAAGRGGPVAKAQATMGEAVAALSTPAEAGGFAGFYAAHSDFLAPDVALPADKPGSPNHGVLTYFLAEALAEGHARSFEDLVPAIRNGYSAVGIQSGDEAAGSPYLVAGDRGIPYFEGSLNAPLPWAVRAGGATSGPARYLMVARDGRILLLAGAIDGLAPGTRLSIEQPGAKRSSGIVKAVHALDAEVEVPGAADWLDGEEAAAAIISAPVETITVARPQGEDKSDAGKRLAAALAHLPAGAALDGARNLAIRLAPPGAAQADMRLVMTNGALSLEAPGMNPAAVTLGADAQAAGRDLRHAIVALYTATNILHTAALLSASPRAEDTAIRQSLAVSAYLWRSPPGVCVVPDSILEGAAIPRGAEPLDLAALAAGKGPLLHQCDSVLLKLANSGATPIDVSPVYVDGNAGITVLGPGSGLRLEPGSDKGRAPVHVVVIPVFLRNPLSGAPMAAGLEQLALIGVGRRAHDAVVWRYGRFAQSGTLAGTASRGEAPNAPSAFQGASALVLRWKVEK